MKRERKQKKLVPYDMVRPGYEAAYTGETIFCIAAEVEAPAARSVDEQGNVIEEWSTWAWTWPGQEEEWGAEVQVLNKMQEQLGPLDETVRRTRAHIGSLVPCDSGLPVAVDELLDAIGRGELREPGFHNGCWHCGVWWETRGSQPGQIESMQVVRAIVVGYLAGETSGVLETRLPQACEFIRRTYYWLGPVKELTELQKLMIERLLLPFEFFTQASHTDPAAWSDDTPDLRATVLNNCFEEGGRGRQIDAEIEALAGLPKINAEWPDEYQAALASISDPEKRELYEICRAIRDGVHTLADCHHATFRIIESWIHAIGTGRLNIPSRKSGTERERLGRLLFGYVLGLDKWLLGQPMQFLLLDLGHVDLEFDPKNEVLRVYAYLGEERTPVKQWLAACLWHTLAYHSIAGNRAGLIRHPELLEHAARVEISVREWMDSVLEPRTLDRGLD